MKIQEIEAGGNHKLKLNSNMMNVHKAYQVCLVHIYAEQIAVSEISLGGS